MLVPLALVNRIVKQNEVVITSTQIMRKADDHGRMVFTALRDIAAGEECCISYIDEIDIDARRRYLQDQFSFTCQCEGCRAEESLE